MLVPQRLWFYAIHHAGDLGTQWPSARGSLPAEMMLAIIPQGLEQLPVMAWQNAPRMEESLLLQN